MPRAAIRERTRRHRDRATFLFTRARKYQNAASVVRWPRAAHAEGCSAQGPASRNAVATLSRADHVAPAGRRSGRFLAADAWLAAECSIPPRANSMSELVGRGRAKSG